MEMEGVNDLLFDLLTEVQENEAYGVMLEDKLQQADLIRRLKTGYQVMVRALTPDEPSQQKLFNNEE